MLDPKAEIEFQKCNLAMGKPVDGEALIVIAEKALTSVEQAEGKLEAYEEVGIDDEKFQFAYNRLRDVVLDATKTIAADRCDAKTRKKVAAMLESTIKNLTENLE